MIRRPSKSLLSKRQVASWFEIEIKIDVEKLQLQ